MSLVGHESGAKIMELQVARIRLCNPMNKTDQDTNSRLVELVSVAMPALTKDILNTKKKCWWNLSLSGGPLSYAGCNGDYCYRYITTKDHCESALGGATQKILIGGRAKINSAAAISDGARNNWYACGPRKDGDNTKKCGFYHLLPDKVKEIFLRLAIITVPETRSNGNSAIARSANRQLALEDLTRQAGMKRASDEFLENMLYYNMWTKEACV